MVKYMRIIMIVLAIIGLTSVVGLPQEEDINITTYYPSPAGSYDNVNISNIAKINNLFLANEGSLYYADGFSVPPYVPAVPPNATTIINENL